jgi:hypothetical protein
MSGGRGETHAGRRLLKGKIRDGVITDEILLDVLGWLPPEKRIPLYNTKHRGGAIQHDGFLLTLDANSARELQSTTKW